MTLGEVLIKLLGDATGLKRAVDEGKRALGDIPGAASQANAQTQQHMSRMGASVGSITKHAADAGTALTKMAGAAYAAFLTYSAGASLLAIRLRAPIDAMGDLVDEAFALGSTVEELSRLQAAVRTVGVDIEQMRMGVAQFAAKMVEARDSTTYAAFAFRKLGVDSRREVIPALLATVEAISQIPDRAAQLDLARDMFGRFGTRLLAVGADMSALMRIAEQTGQVIPNSLGRAADEASDKFETLLGTMQGFGRRAVIPLIAPLKEASERLTEFFAHDPRLLEVAQRATSALGASLIQLTSKENLDGLTDLVEAFSNLAGNLGRTAANASAVLPGFKNIATGISDILEQFNRLPPELRGTIFGAVTGGIIAGPKGAALGAYAGLRGGVKESEAQTVLSFRKDAQAQLEAVEQRMRARERAAATGGATLSAAELRRLEAQATSPAARTLGQLPTTGKAPPSIAVIEQQGGKDFAGRIWKTDAELAASLRATVTGLTRQAEVLKPGSTASPSPTAPPSPTRPPVAGVAGEEDWKRQWERGKKANEEAAKAAEKAAREAERLAAWWEKAPAQIEDIRDAEERLAVTRDAVSEYYKETVRKPTQIEALGGGADYFATIADLADEAEREVAQFNEELRNLAATSAAATVQSSVFASALEVLFGTGPIQDRLSNVLQRRFADILDALYRSVEQQADKRTTTTGQASTSPWMDWLKSILGGGRKEEPTSTPTTEPTMTKMPEAATAGILAKIETVGTKMMGAAAVAQAGAQVVADTITGIRELRDIVDKMSEQPGVTSSELYAVGSSRFPFIGKFLEPFNQIASSILGRNAPAPATGALAGVTAGAAIGAFGGPPGIAIGAAIGAALGAVLGKLFQAPTAEAQLNRALARYTEQVGIPRVLPGDRGINLRAFGRSGGPTQPAFADIDAQQAAFAGRMFATEAGKLPERGAIPGRVQQFLVNTATALRLTADEADRMFRRFEQPLLGKNLEDALLRLTSLRAQGRITASDMQAGFARAVQIFEDLPDAINTSRLALAAFDEAGRVNFQTLTRAAEDARKVIVEGMGQTFTTLIQTGSAEAAGRTLASSFADTFVEAVMQELQAAPLSSALTDAVVMARQAAIAFREGDRQEARRLLVDARREFLQGRQEWLEFLGPIASDTRTFTQGLTGAGGFINQRVPSFDVGGLVPGAIGQPMLATVHGGEFVLRSQDTQQMVSLLQQVASAVQRGWSVTVQDRSVHTVEIDGRELARVQANTDRLHRGAGVVLPQTGLGVR